MSQNEYSTRRLSLPKNSENNYSRPSCTFTIPDMTYKAPSPKYNLPLSGLPIEKHTFFFDVDNTLYEEHYGIHHLMAERIIQYCQNMGMGSEVAKELSTRYYKDYGLAIRGLIKVN